MFTISALLLGSESVTGEDEATSGVRVMSWAGQLNNETKPTRKDSFHSVMLFSCCYLTRAVRERQSVLCSLSDLPRREFLGLKCAVPTFSPFLHTIHLGM